MTQNPPPPKLLRFDKAQLFLIFFFGILIFLLYQLLHILSPFIGALIVAAAFAIIFFPIHVWIRKKVISNRSASAAVSTAIAVFTLALPLLVFGWLLMAESRDLYPKTNQWLSAISQKDLDITLPDRIKAYVNIDVNEILTGAVKNMQEKINRSGAGLLKNILFFFINFGVMVFSLFALFRDGERFLHWLIDIIPMDQEYKHRVANQLYVTTMAVVRGLLLTAIIQGFIGAFGYWLAGVKSPALFGLLTTFAALVPFVGTTLVWVPLSVAMYFISGFKTGLFLALWGGLAVGLTDNFLRPILIGKGAKLPVFLLFLGIIGGMKVYGPLGLFLGPLLISCVIVFLQIYKEAKNLPHLPPPENGAAAAPPPAGAQR